MIPNWEEADWAAIRDDLAWAVHWGAQHAATATADEREYLNWCVTAGETMLTLERNDPASSARLTRTLEAYGLRILSMSGEELAGYCQRIINENPEIKKRGPKRGETGYLRADMALIPDIKSRMSEGARSMLDAVKKLEEDGKISGANSDADSRIQRLYRFARKHLED